MFDTKPRVMRIHENPPQRPLISFLLLPFHSVEVFKAQRTKEFCQGDAAAYPRKRRCFADRQRRVSVCP